MENKGQCGLVGKGQDARKVACHVVKRVQERVGGKTDRVKSKGGSLHCTVKNEPEK